MQHWQQEKKTGIYKIIINWRTDIHFMMLI